MKRAFLLLSCLSLTLNASELSEIRSVYMLPMGSALDQYIANRLTSMHVLQVVTDPQKAEAVFTDRLGEALESRLDELYAKPAPPAAAPEKEKGKEQETANKPSKAGMLSSFGRGKGTVFLVDVKSRQVLWSIYEKPKYSGARQLDRTAARIVDQLKKDRSGK